MKNKNVDIYFFTGTGNTYLAAKKISAVMKNNGCEANLLNMENAKPENVDLSKTLGIGFPIACWNTYPVVRKFVKALPDGAGAEVFVFATMGDSSLKTSENIASVLKKKVYSVLAAKGFKMPNNWLGITTEEKNAAKKEKTYTQIESFASDLAGGSSKYSKANLFFKLCFVVTSLITNVFWKGKLWQNIIRFKTDKRKCSKCELCVKICPVSNITMTEYPEFGKNCQLCMRCFSYCPEQALKSSVTGKKRYKALDDREAMECFLRK